MNSLVSTFKNISLILGMVLCSISFSNAQNLYWIGGSGNWSNPAKWSSTSGGAPALSVPDQSTSAVFDQNSGLSNGNSIVIPIGTHSVNNLTVSSTAANFDFIFNGAAGITVMNVYFQVSDLQYNRY